MCEVFSPKDRETRKARGFTFCQYRRKEDAAEAVKGMDKRVWVLDDSVVIQTSVVPCLCHLRACLFCPDEKKKFFWRVHRSRYAWCYSHTEGRGWSFML